MIVAERVTWTLLAVYLTLLSATSHERDPSVSSRCRAGNHVMCPEKAGIGKDCTCACHSQNADEGGKG